MLPEMGEYLVRAYLEHCKGCKIVCYNVKTGKGQGEIDVMGFNFPEKTIFICEVATHLDGILYGKTLDTTVEKILSKFENMKTYVEENINKNKCFNKVHYMFWAPKVSGNTLKALEEKISEFKKTLNSEEELKLVINDEYTKCFHELKEKAKKSTTDTGNPAFRMLQIEQHFLIKVKKNKFKREIEEAFNRAAHLKM
ncbi:MAG: hypothetical protein K6357_00790 [Elusimicrobiota bacterium]